MTAYFDGLIAGLLDGLQPGAVMHFGAAAQSVVPKLARAMAARGGTLHVVHRGSPLPMDALRADCGDHLVVHNGPGTDAIALMATPDIAILDDDPNWFTTHALLTALHAKAAAQDRPLPVILLRNTFWPYARRDGYTDPNAIPQAFRLPHERAGISPGQDPLSGRHGLFADRYNASTPNLPRDGVLTALEDFAARGDFAIWHWPFQHGASLLAARDSVIFGRLVPLMRGLALPEPAFQLAAAAEADRVAALMAAQDTALQLGQAQAHIAAMRAALASERQAFAGLRSAAAQGAAAVPGFYQAASASALLVRGAAAGATATATAAPTVAPAPPLAGTPDPDALAALRETPLFDAGWYLAAYPQVAAARHDPAAHYLLAGAAAGYNPGPAFNTAWYVARYPDVSQAGVNPLLHYLRDGVAEGRDPSPDFSTSAYLADYPDVAGAGLNPLAHYVANGRGEGRVARPAAV